MMMIMMMKWYNDDDDDHHHHHDHQTGGCDNMKQTEFWFSLAHCVDMAETGCQNSPDDGHEESSSRKC